MYPLAGIAEPLSCWSHLIAALVFLALTISRLRRERCTRRMLSWAVFSLSSVLLLSLSATYHLLPQESAARLFFQRLDHAAIYLVIAGTFTAVHDMLFSGMLRWVSIVLIWIAAAAGMALKTTYFDLVPESWGLLTYLVFGWFGVVSASLAARIVGFAFLRPLLYGGIAYTIGAVLDYSRYPVLIKGVLGPHELFHLAVIAGLTLHWRFVSDCILHRRERAVALKAPAAQ